MKIPYALTAAVAIEQRYAHMASAIARPLPRLQRAPIDDQRTLHVVCYGPSLKDTWQDLRHPIISMSGATKWLYERGITPDYHCDMDPRPNKVTDVSPPVPGVTYLMASVCVPAVFDVLANENVILWHTVSSKWDSDIQWVAERDPGQLVVSTGSTIGLGAIQLGGILGYRRFEIHGMDGSFAGDERHAGVHTGKAQPPSFTWNAGGVTYRTSQIMANAVAETINTFKNFPIFGVFHGSGLTQALIREANTPNACCADEVEKAARIRRAMARFVPVPKVESKGTGSFWDALLAQPSCPLWLTEVLTIAREAEPLRVKAAYNTGTVPAETAFLLRALCGWYRPKVVVEIGTFIGVSTLSLTAEEHLYTCDRSNDCLPSTSRVTCHPGLGSSELLQRLIDRNVTVDLFFFDGRLDVGDVARVLKLSHGKTVYVFDDYVGKEKGVINLGKMATMLPNHVLVEPYAAFEGRTTLAALVPVGTP